MNSGSTPRKKEPKRTSFWFDPRFAIGVGLVVVSVLGVLGLVATADSSVQVYAARSALAPGDRIRAGDLVAKSVRLGELGSKYLVDADLPTEGLVVTRTISAGELVPTSAVGNVAGLRVASVVVTIRGQLPKSVTAGAVVDLWSAKETDNRVFGPPTVLVSSATVVRVIESDGLVSKGSVGAVEVLVPRTKTARVLGAIANEDAISLVPVSIPVKD
ncbi:MAG: flagella basal body P-ring formation protein FlgA [Lacisediminihabitans sp.]